MTVQLCALYFRAGFMTSADLDKQLALKGLTIGFTWLTNSAKQMAAMLCYAVHCLFCCSQCQETSVFMFVMVVNCSCM